MKRKKILIINPGALFPKVMAFQDRVINMTKCLNEKHDVDIICLYTTVKERKYNQEYLAEICNRFYLIKKPNNIFIKRKLWGILRFILHKVILIPKEMIYPNWPSVRKNILNIIRKNQYNIIQIETWWQSSLFKYVSPEILKVVDTHDVMYEKRECERQYLKNNRLTKRDKKFLNKYKELELKNTSMADTIISISPLDETVFKEHFPEKHHLMIPTGQDLAYFLNYLNINTNKTILFYGSMGGEQNVIAFWRLYNNILPEIKKENPSVKLIVLGATPPKEIINLDKGNSIIITGYVEDVREYISKSSVMILPLVTGGGFRSRIIDVMAMGVPVIGTHNALDSIEMTNCVHGYITDNDDEMVKHAIELLNNHNLRNKMSEECIKFVSEKYTIEATYGKLSKYYSEL